jgi:hypothetical protein
MAEVTDLALDLAELCDHLNVNSQQAGDDFLASHFGVDAWSPEFFQIIFVIVSRTVALEELITSTKANPAVIRGAAAHLVQIRQAFSKGPLRHAWNQQGQTLIGPAHSSPVRMLSAAIPDEHKYPKLAEDETAELKGMVEQLLDWLRNTQLSERDFIRQSLIEGLEHFLFRLERLQWFGWGYSVESLREVILAYIALERGLKPQANPDAAAVLKKLKTVLRKVFGYASTAKEAAGTGDWILGCYRTVVTATSSGATGYIAGLLTN